MHDELWTDDRFRTFFASFRSGGLFGADVDDIDRDAFIRQAERRIAPEVQRRLLAEVGAIVSEPGIALVAFDVLERTAWDKRRAWLLVAGSPWTLLADAVTREIRSSYRATARRGDGKHLAGIASASSRLALEPDSEPRAGACLSSRRPGVRSRARSSRRDP